MEARFGLEPGEQLALDEMLKAICISSANDAAVAVAEFIGGSEPVFVERMNARAKELGMQSTTFRNACGLDEDGHLSHRARCRHHDREMLLTTRKLKITALIGGYPARRCNPTGEHQQTAEKL